MKKVFLIITAVTAISGLSASGQGYFIFSGGPRSVWDLWSGGARTSTNNRVAFLWGSGVPLVSAIKVSTPTNEGGFYPQAWTPILNDPNFHLALNNTDGSLVAVNCAANGAWSYSIGATFPVTGTSPGAYQVFVIGWPAVYPTPAAAAAAFAPIGWSNPFSYTATGQLGTPLTMAQSGFRAFGIPATPEPSVFSLVGMAAATVLLRRRKLRVTATEPV